MQDDVCEASSVYVFAVSVYVFAVAVYVFATFDCSHFEMHLNDDFVEIVAIVVAVAADDDVDVERRSSCSKAVEYYLAAWERSCLKIVFE